MARRRKNEAKASVKSLQKFIAVRKSSRQIAKKQQQEQKFNGEVLQSSSNNSDDSKDGHDETDEQLQTSKHFTVPKKVTSYHRTLNCEKIMDGNEVDESLVSFKGDCDSQDGLNNFLVSPSKLNPEEVTHVNIDLSNPNHESRNDNASNDVWSEDVIEETIICEEMEVQEVVEDAVSQDNSVFVEQVLLVDKPDFEGKNIVEFTVIQNDDGTESMLMSSNMENITPEHSRGLNLFQSIEEGVGSLRMSESDSLTLVKGSKSGIKGDKVKLTPIIENTRQCKEKKVPIPITSDFIESSETVFSLNNKDEEIKAANSLIKNAKSSKINSYIETSSSSLISDSKFKAIIENSQELEALTVKMPIEKSSILTKNILLLKQKDITNSLDRIKELSIQDEENYSSTQKNETNVVLSRVDRVFNNDSLNIRNIEDRLTPIPKDIGEFINDNVPKSMDCLQNIEEYSRDSEADVKPDFEYVKLSSGSENSSDTLLSANSYKLPELGPEAKNINSSNEGEKKSGFRSRSGSTDTTGSESGSNSSGVRRSSRIRTIGLMKQRYCFLINFCYMLYTYVNI